MEVVISQPKIIYGGRIKVLLGITEALNSLGVEPVWLSASLPGTKEEILTRYRTSARFNYKPLVTKVRWRAEIANRSFNSLTASYCNKNGVDWLIDSSNTVQCLNGFPRVISYVHFPREARVLDNEKSLHHPGEMLSWRQKEFWGRKLNRKIYEAGKNSVSKEHVVVANSQFTRKAFLSYYDHVDFRREPIVVYPFADQPELPLPNAEGRVNAVASLGRFCEAKGQMVQAQLASKAPEFEFWLMGHADPNNQYFNSIKEYVETNKLTNVKLLANLSFEEVQQRLRKASFFLHCNINEPFGITSVEGLLAGCLPIVHNSGGQKEVVPVEELRFDDVAELPAVLGLLKEADLKQRQDWLGRLQQIALANFVHDVFVNRFAGFFNALTSESHSS